ncbi:MAG: S41 family peptidase [Holophaga sp.]|nr:S41 family peptidase [Holophaga sp.]
MHIRTGMSLCALLCQAGYQEIAAQPDPQAEKQSLVDLVERHYLWGGALPGDLDVTAFPSPAALLDHLTSRARTEGKDRHWSALRDKARDGAPPGMFGCGFAMDYGAQFMAKGSRVFVTQVLRHSGASRAGIARGDEVLAVAPRREDLAAPENQVSGLLPSGNWWKALGPQSTWTRRHFRLRRPGGGTAEVSASMTMSRLEPVPEAAEPRILEAGGHRVGYLQVRGFVTWAERPLQTLMGRYGKAGVTDLIIDLRYNEGGSLDTVEALVNLLRADAGPADVMFRFRRKPGAPEEMRYFRPHAKALRLGRVAFITSRATASGAEAVVNALLPYFGPNLALVGDRTYGKPVGREVLPLPSSTLELHLVTFQVLNARGEGDYFQGLPAPGFQGATCLAADDLDHAMGDPAEACTAAALDWIAEGPAVRRPIPLPPAPGLSNEDSKAPMPP